MVIKLKDHEDSIVNIPDNIFYTIGDEMEEFER